MAARSKKSHSVQGVIKAISPSNATSFGDKNSRGADLTFSIWLHDRLLIDVTYHFGGEQYGAYQNWQRLFKTEMTVEMILGTPPSPKVSSYQGVGAIRIILDGEDAPWFPVSDTIFHSDTDIVRRLTREEQIKWRMLLEEAKDEIRSKFAPSKEQAQLIDERIETAARALPKVSSFNWKKLIVECIIGISVDLGMGKTVPESLLNVFQKLVESYTVHKLAGD